MRSGGRESKISSSPGIIIEASLGEKLHLRTRMRGEANRRGQETTLRAREVISLGKIMTGADKKIIIGTETVKDGMTTEAIIIMKAGTNIKTKEIGITIMMIISIGISQGPGETMTGEGKGLAHLMTMRGEESKGITTASTIEIGTTEGMTAGEMNEIEKDLDQSLITIEIMTDEITNTKIARMSGETTAVMTAKTATAPPKIEIKMSRNPLKSAV